MLEGQNITTNPRLFTDHISVFLFLFFYRQIEYHMGSVYIVGKLCLLPPLSKRHQDPDPCGPLCLVLDFCTTAYYEQQIVSFFDAFSHGLVCSM